jgi:probable rRNA maturation factor
MARHEIILSRDKRGLHTGRVKPLIWRAIQTALDAEGINVPCEISVMITDNDGIRKINKAFRNIDAPTDVLSFPMQELTPGAFSADDGEISPESGLFPLGDIVLSMERIRTQALEFGHSVHREMAYLTVHSVLHLLGYDHVDEGVEKRQMRTREKEIMTRMGDL